jgi:hypothetical protein
VIEAGARTTAPARLLELASVHPQLVLENRLLRRLRVADPAAHDEIVLAARFGRAELALAEAMARTDEATLRVFACDCAARVAPLYERFVGSSDLLARARARAVASPRPPVSESAAVNGARPNATESAFVRVEASVDALERQTAREASVSSGATGALRRLIFERSEEQVSRLERGSAGGAATGEPPFRLLAIALPAAEAIDEALVVAAGGDIHRMDTMFEAIAEAVYLEHAFATGEAQPGIEAVFREVAWQRSRLRALQAS